MTINIFTLILLNLLFYDVPSYWYLGLRLLYYFTKYVYPHQFLQIQLQITWHIHDILIDILMDMILRFSIFRFLILGYDVLFHILWHSKLIQIIEHIIWYLLRFTIICDPHIVNYFFFGFLNRIINFGLICFELLNVLLGMFVVLQLKKIMCV